MPDVRRIVAKEGRKFIDAVQNRDVAQSTCRKRSRSKGNGVDTIDLDAGVITVYGNTVAEVGM